jgi:hypothetical protein
MEGLTRLVSESLARHGFDRPLDYRRLHWSRWFRCDSHHSLLSVPSKPGVFAVAEEIMDFGQNADSVGRKDASAGRKDDYVGTAASAVQRSEASGTVWDRVSDPVRSSEARLDVSASSSAASQLANPSRGAATQFSPALQRWEQTANENQVPEGRHKRMLAVTQFFEDDDMAFVLDRMLSRQNPMAARLASGRYFVRFVVIEDPTQRRSICSALNQWMVSAAEKATGIGAHFATSLELTPATEYNPQADERQQSLFAGPTDTNVAADAFVRPPAPSAAESVWDRVSDSVGPSEARQDVAGMTDARVATAASQACPEPSRRVPRSEASGSGTELGFSAPASSPTAPHLNSGAATNIHCPSPFPSGF